MKIDIKSLLLGIVTAILFSAFIYLAEYNLTIKLINSIFGLMAFAMFLYIPKKSILYAGFFIGIFWFYWVGYSFKYQNVAYMEPIIIFVFAFFYLLFFSPLYFTKNALYRAILLFGLSFIEPFHNNWMQMNLLFVDSYIGVYKYQLLSLLLALSLPSLLRGRYKYTPLMLLLFSINYGYGVQKDAPLKIKLIQTNISQDGKWLRKNLLPTVSMIFQKIQEAKANHYDVIIFPESVFPIYMNQNPKILQKLQEDSKSITIVAGSLLEENFHHYNVTYMFDKGKYTIAKKLVLVPFGEYIPLPQFARKIINDTFFSGASDFVTAKKPTDFIIKGVKFRNAICYEATSKELYEGNFDFMIATSNNAWFTPSIEPTLQNLLLKYYARQHGVTIYHSANYKGTGVVK